MDVSFWNWEISLEEYVENSPYLARKYARIFVRVHYLFQDTNSFLRAKLEENYQLQGTDNVQGQTYQHIFVKYCNACEKIFTNSLLFTERDFFFWVLSVTALWTKQIFLFFCNKHKTLFHLELNFKRRLVVVDEGFENWRISLGWYPLISHSFSSYLVTWWFRPIAYEQKCLMDHNIGFSLALAGAY